MSKPVTGKAKPAKIILGAAEKRTMPRQFLLPSIMLFLAEAPSHGYALLKELVGIGVADKRLSLPIVYRDLLQLEGRRLATFRFAKPEGKGPAKKVYHLTEKGWKELASWAESLKEVKEFIEEFQVRYEAVESARSSGL